jgi:CRISPR/Cas system-associated exonuclease Cas4 (RecB family)
MSDTFDLTDTGFSEKQSALIEYLMLRLGFSKGSFSNQYLRKLLSKAHLHRNVRAIKIEESDFANNPPDFYFRHEDRYLPRKYNIIDFLIDEYKIKKNKSYEIARSVTDFVSATDLANFTYCPVGYSLSKSFQIPPLISAERGKTLHEEAWLIRIKGFLESTELKTEVIDSADQDNFYSTDSENITDILTPENIPFFEDIKSAKLVYSGHSQTRDMKSYFKNDTFNFVGQPDYVFENKDGETFIVEEKYKTMFGSGHDPLYSNHKIQLASYIYYLDELKASYGYLVYWVKQREVEEDGYINESRRCFVKKIIKSVAVKEFLDNAYNDLVSYIEKKYLCFNPEGLSPTRCASCVFSMYCGHKTGRRNQVTLPYQRGYHNLYPAKYPDILKAKG